MSFKVRAMYDFSGEPNTSELSIKQGDILTVTRTNAGEGWWEGTNSVGQIGLFPASYVEKITASESNPPEIPAPILPVQSDWNDTTNVQAVQLYSQDGEGWDDDWDDETYSEIGPGRSESKQSESEQIYANESVIQNQPSHYPMQSEDTISNYGSENRGPVTKKTLNRFSTFVKSGGESYLYGTLKVHISDADKVHISSMEDGYSWPPILQPFSVMVASPTKESKLKGLKSFIAYRLTPSFSNIQVSRRYKHFDWLHERLTEKFCIIPIPPLPEKQVSGRYEEHFIEHRRVQLQEFVDWVCRHPVLSRCEVWQHFLTCTDEKLWKAGKRQAERDQLIGANFCLAIDAPEKTLLPTYLDSQIDKCTNFIHSLDNSIKNMMATATDQIKKHQSPYTREFQRIGESFFGFGISLELDEGTIIPTSPLTIAIKKLGGAYIEISKMYEEQPKCDWEPLADKLHLYKGITGAFPDVLSVHRGALQKRKECDKLAQEQKMEIAQYNDISRRTDVISYAVLAEVNHFKSERTRDINKAMKEFLSQQIKFYQRIVNKLESALENFED